MKILFIRNSCTLMSHSQIGYGFGIVVTVASRAGHEVRAIDNNTLYKLYEEKDFEKILLEFKPDVLAYGITLHNAYETYRQIPRFKKLLPGLVVVAGGVHMKHCAEEALRKGVDAVVEREGELVVPPLFAHIEKAGPGRWRENLEKIEGVSFVREDGSFHRAASFPCLENMDDVPEVEYELLNLKDFIKVGSEPGVFYLVGQRGCPFQCSFCFDEIQRNDRRNSSAAWLFNNVRRLHEKYNANYILLADNNITLNRERLTAFCRMMIDSGLNKKVSFSSQTTTRFPLDEELVKLMKEAGFLRINFGLERLTPYSLKMVNKEQPIENIHQILGLVSRNGIDPSLFMLIGFPFETVELLQEEKRLFLELTKYTKRMFMSILAPAPGTVYYDNYPAVKDWYLDEKAYLMLRTHFANALDMHTFNTIERNFFGLPPEVLDAMKDCYFTFKNLTHGSVFTRKTPLIWTLMKLDYLAAKVSQGMFAVSPALETFFFRRFKAFRYYVGNYLLDKHITGKK